MNVRRACQILSAALVLLLGAAQAGVALAATGGTGGQGTPDAQRSTDPACKELSETQRRALVDVNTRDANIFMTYVRAPLSVAARSCLDSLFSRLRVGFSFFDPASLLRSLVAGVIDAACRAARSTIDQQLSVLNQNISLGGVVQARTRAGASGVSVNVGVRPPNAGDIIRSLR